MTVTSKSILQNSLKELKKRRTQIDKELLNCNESIVSIEAIIGGSSISPFSSAPLAPEEKPESKEKRKQSVKRITEEMVRDAIIEIVKNPPAPLFGPHEFQTGFFSGSQLATVMGINSSSPSPSIKKYLEKFHDKGILTRLPYKNGHQYKYIPPAETGSGINQAVQSSQSEIAQNGNSNSSEPIPGTGLSGKEHTRDKDIQKMVRKAENDGFVVKRLGNDHIRVTNPAYAEKFATISATGSGGRQINNVRAELRRVGVSV